jgi:hypothetical protein
MMQAIIRYDITGGMDGGYVPAWQPRWNRDTRGSSRRASAYPVSHCICYEAEDEV